MATAPELPPDAEHPPGVSPGAAAPAGRDLAGALRLVAMREHSLVSLAELAQSLGGTTDLFELADGLLFSLMGQLAVPRAALWVLSDDPGEMPVLIRAHGINRQVATAVGGACVAPLVDVPGLDARPIRGGDLERLAGGGAAALAASAGIEVFARIEWHGQVLGIVALGDRVAEGDYSELDLQALRAALAVAGVVIQNLGLYGRMVESNRHLRRANEELRTLDRLKSEFISNVNHELRTPLATILGYADCLQTPGIGEEQARRMLGTIQEEARRLRGLVENLLTYSAAVDHRLELEMVTGDVRECIDRYCRERRPGVSESLREFAWTFAPDLPEVRFDEKQLLDVIEALVDNAVKFTPEGARVEISVRPEDTPGCSGVMIDVSDDGPGVPPDRLATLFQPFRQLDGSSSRRVGGMGMGLALCREIVTAMGGTITAASELGRGSTFRLILPEA